MSYTPDQINTIVASAQSTLGADWFVSASLGSSRANEQGAETLVTEYVLQAALIGSIPEKRVQASTEAQLATLATAAEA